MEVESRLILPDGWRSVAPPLPFVLAPGETALRLVSFTIPEDARAGEYPVVFEVRDRLKPAEADSWRVTIRVKPTGRLQSRVLDLPAQAVSGDSFGCTLWLRNAGNAPADLSFRIRHRHVADVAPRQGSKRLQPGETRQIQLEVTLDEVRDRAVGRIDVELAAEGVAIDARNGGSLQILPRARVLDAWQLLQSRVEARYVGRDASPGRTSGWQPSISGGGLLDEGRLDELHFLLRGPDRRQRGSFGSSEEYWLRYSRPGFSAGAGDLIYGMSPLTEPGRLGRGVTFDLDRESWGASAYVMRDQFGNTAAGQAGMTARFAANAVHEFGVQLLARSDADADAGRIWTVRAQSALGPASELDVEIGESIGADSRGSAIRFALRGERRGLRYYALGWSADERFLGPLRDRMYLTTGFDLARSRGWGLRGYFRSQDWNVQPLEQIDPDLHDVMPVNDRMASAPRERQMSLGTSRSPWTGGKATLDVVRRDRTSRDSDARAVARESWSGRFGFSQAWRDLSLVYSLEQGRAFDRLIDTRFATASEMLSGSWRIAKGLTLGGYWMQDDNSELDERDPRRVSRGVNLNVSAGAWSLSMDSQRTQSAFGRSGIHALSLRHEPQGGARTMLSARRIEGRFARTDFMASFSMPFGMPVKRQRGVESVRGRVFDAQTDAGIRDVVLRLGGVVASTNAKGEFRFPAVRAGTHQIVFERGLPDVSLVPEGGQPLEVRATGGEIPSIRLPLVRSASLVVALKLRDEQEQISPAVGLLVNFRQGDLVFRRVSDAAGNVRLAGIPPGEWRLSVAEDTLPPGFEPAATDLVLKPSPGQTVEAELTFSRRHREMQMLPPLAVR
jgi:hypothetical protein